MTEEETLTKEEKQKLKENPRTWRVYIDKTVTEEFVVEAYTKDEAMVFMPTLHQRAIAMTTATEFLPNPSKTNCRWCSYGKGGYPVCQHGIE